MKIYWNISRESTTIFELVYLQCFKCNNDKCPKNEHILKTFDSIKDSIYR